MKKTGLALIAVTILIPLIWFIPMAGKHDPVAVFSQYLGSAALIGMGIVQFLATRTRWSEALFGPLDRIYQLHKWLAVGSIAAAAMHDMIDAEMDELGRMTALAQIAETAGELSFNGLLLLGFATIIPFIPYQYWKLSHKFIGAFFALAAFHFAFILKPFSLGDPVGLYVLSFCLLGVGCYLYMLLLHAWAPRPLPYSVTGVEHHGDIAEITLAPEKSALRHRPGQFAFISFDLPGLTEAHPFTISGAPNDDGDLKFAIKRLGDYTANLTRELATGQKANIRGAYGGFLRPQDAAPQVWIGAGIGVTPFLSWARSLNDKPEGSAVFYYCVHDQTAPFIEELQTIADRNGSLTLNIVTSNTGRLTPERISDDLGGKLAGSKVYFCGPANMREALATGLETAGLSRKHFHYEEFEIRSGIGIRKLAAWLWEQVNKRRAKPDATS